MQRPRRRMPLHRTLPPPHWGDAVKTKPADGSSAVGRHSGGFLSRFPFMAYVRFVCIVAVMSTTALCSAQTLASHTADDIFAPVSHALDSGAYDLADTLASAAYSQFTTESRPSAESLAALRLFLTARVKNGK